MGDISKPFGHRDGILAGRRKVLQNVANSIEDAKGLAPGLHGHLVFAGQFITTFS